MTVSATTAIGGVSRIPSYYRARYYNPTTGRFLSEDPIGFAGGFNLYAYAANNPLSFDDPFGTCTSIQSSLSAIHWIPKNQAECLVLKSKLDDLLIFAALLAFVAFMIGIAIAIMGGPAAWPILSFVGLLIAGLGTETGLIRALSVKFQLNANCH